MVELNCSSSCLAVGEIKGNFGLSKKIKRVIQEENHLTVL